MVDTRQNNDTIVVMVETKLKNAYRIAVKRWGSLIWSLTSFVEHINRIRTKGIEPVYLEDTLLAGSAGYRNEPAWEAIENEFADRLKRLMYARATADMTPDEVWSETVGYFIDEDRNEPPLPGGNYPARIIRYQGIARLFSYITTKAIWITQQRKSKHKPDHLSTEFNRASGTANPLEQVMDEESLRNFEQAFTDAYMRLSPEQRFIVMMVYGQGMRQKEIARQLKWSDFKVNRQLKKALNLLRDAVGHIAGRYDHFTVVFDRLFKGAGVNMKTNPKR